MIRKDGRTRRRLRKLLRPLFRSDFAANFGVMLPLRDPLISTGIAKEIFFGDYERKEAEIVTQRLEATDVVMEIGAGMGFLSAFCAKKIGSERVFAYEANPALIPLIDKTYEANGIGPTVKNAMLGRGQGRASFYVEEEFWASTNVASNTRSAKLIEVDQLDLNTEIAQVKPTFLIVDIEGGEAELFPLADLSGVEKICVETHPHALGNGGVSKLLSLLFERGFVLDISLIRKNVFYLYRLRPDRAP